MMGMKWRSGREVGKKWERSGKEVDDNVMKWSG